MKQKQEPVKSYRWWEHQHVKHYLYALRLFFWINVARLGKTKSGYPKSLHSLISLERGTFRKFEEIFKDEEDDNEELDLDELNVKIYSFFKTKKKFSVEKVPSACSCRRCIEDPDWCRRLRAFGFTEFEQNFWAENFTDDKQKLLKFLPHRRIFVKPPADLADLTAMMQKDLVKLHRQFENALKQAVEGQAQEDQGEDSKIQVVEIKSAEKIPGRVDEEEEKLKKWKALTSWLDDGDSDDEQI